MTAGLDTVAIRVPMTIFNNERIDFPLQLQVPTHLATSVLHGQYMFKDPGQQDRWYLEGGILHPRIESTILDLREPNMPVILRQGPITQSAIAFALKRPLADAPSA